MEMSLPHDVQMQLFKIPRQVSRLALVPTLPPSAGLKINSAARFSTWAERQRAEAEEAAPTVQTPSDSSGGGGSGSPAVQTAPARFAGAEVIRAPKPPAPASVRRDLFGAAAEMQAQRTSQQASQWSPAKCAADLMPQTSDGDGVPEDIGNDMRGANSIGYMKQSHDDAAQQALRPQADVPQHLPQPQQSESDSDVRPGDSYLLGCSQQFGDSSQCSVQGSAGAGTLPLQKAAGSAGRHANAGDGLAAPATWPAAAGRSGRKRRRHEDSDDDCIDLA